MAYTNIDKSKEHFETTTYTGGATDVSTLNFKPDFVWAKKRSGSENHGLFDAVRGATKTLSSNATSAESTRSGSLTSFDNDGWSMGGSDGIISASGSTYVGWAWKANGAGSSNTDGDITSTVSANTTSGFSIVSYTGNGSTSQTVGHGLGASPSMVIIKNRDVSTEGWWTQHTSFASGTYYNRLNSTDSTGNSGGTNIFNGFPTSTVFNINDGNGVNKSGSDFIAYCFAEKTGFSKFASYTGTGVEEGTFVYTGFKPAFVMVKRTNTTSDWVICDSTRDTDNGVFKKLFPNLSQAEDSYVSFDFLSNGFKLRTANGGINGGGDPHIYMAFAEAPLVGSNNVPCTAR